MSFDTQVILDFPIHASGFCVTAENYTARCKFLDAGDKVKVTVLFRGREMAHPEIGRGLLDQLAETLRSHGTVEQAPRLEGRTMTMTFAPLKQKQSHREKESSGEKHEESEAQDA